MLRFLRPKTTCSELAAFFAARVLMFIWPGFSADLDKEFELLGECGAAKDRIRPEMAALCAFAYYRGMLAASEEGAITKDQLESLESAYTAELDHRVRIISDEHIPSLQYDNFGEWLHARLQRHTLVVASASTFDDTTGMILEHFADFSCDDAPSEILQLKFRATYDQTVTNATKMIASHRVN
jgi:hypothetical protein